MNKRKSFSLLLLMVSVLPGLAQKKSTFNGLDMNLGNLYRLSDAKTRSISPENFTGEKGKGGMATLETGNAAHAARELGQGWKVNPYIHIKPGQTYTLAEITGPGAIQHIWMTPTGNWRYSIIRIYWDDEKEPSVEAPVGDFFCMGWGVFDPLSSLAVAVNPGSAFNCYWVMPFRRKCKITMENINTEQMTLYYQIDYTLTEVPEDAAYFHAQFRRVNPVPYKEVYTIVDGIRGKGHYVGTYMAWGVTNNGWWGEGEIKFYLDGDTQFPTINGTGTEDYFCGSYNFENKVTRQYQTYTTAYAGLSQVIRPDGVYNSQQRFGMYRWHIVDPVRFEKDLRITIQDLGWRANGAYLPQRSNIASVAYWYQTEPHNPFPKLPEKHELDVN
jgi:hypothetical protein